MQYQRFARGDAEADASARAAAGKPQSCPACDGKKRAHTCGRGLKNARAAPGTAGATASRLGEPEDSEPAHDSMMHIIRSGDDAAARFFEPEQMRENVLAAQQAERATAARKKEAEAARIAPPTTVMSAARAAVGSAAVLLTSPMRWAYRRAWQSSAEVADPEDDADPGEPAAAADPEDDTEEAMAERAFAKLRDRSGNTPAAVVAALNAMRTSLTSGGPLPDWARRGYEYLMPLPLRWDQRGWPLEPEPTDWAVAGRRVYLLNLSKQRPVLLSKPLCPLCRSATRSLQCSLTMSDRKGITLVLETDSSYGYLASWQRSCLAANCGVTFFDYDVIEQLPAGERSSLPISQPMATGEVFIGKYLEMEITLAMTKGLGAATIANIKNVIAKQRYDSELEAYLQHGDVRRCEHWVYTHWHSRRARALAPRERAHGAHGAPGGAPGDVHPFDRAFRRGRNAPMPPDL